MSEKGATGNSQRAQSSAARGLTSLSVVSKLNEGKTIILHRPILPPPTGCSSTPIKASTHFEQPPPFVHDMRPAMAAELNDSDISYKPKSSQIFTSYDKDTISNFLSQCDLYDSDSKEWPALATFVKNVQKAKDAKRMQRLAKTKAQKSSRTENNDESDENSNESDEDGGKSDEDGGESDEDVNEIDQDSDDIDEAGDMSNSDGYENGENNDESNTSSDNNESDANNAKVEKDAPNLTHEKHLYKPLHQIIKAIIEYFREDFSSEPWIEDTHKRRLAHVEDGVRIYREVAVGHLIAVSPKSSPDFAIMDKSRHLSAEQDTSKDLDYRHCLAPLEVKTDETLKFFEARDQIGIYVRQCFIQQPHRRYVPTLVLTQSSAYLRVYDRSGVLSCDSPINLHADAKTFVRVILGICTMTDDLKSSAFDPRVTWDTKGKWPKISVATRNRSTRSSTTPRVLVVYQVTNSPFIRRSIRGRGTVCWPAQQVEPSPEKGAVVTVLIKDSWRSAGRKNEWELLEAVKGLAGVGQMIAYEDDTNDCISRFRNFIVQDLYDIDKRFYDADRIFSRIVLEAYGPSIKHFKNKLQLLYAFYDAVAGHKNMWLKSKILHRDISLENILFGKEDAEAENRGILIDMDMAIRVDRETNLSEKGQVRTGTRAYQSVAVLRSLKWINAYSTAPPQDHLDDLESFFHVLSWICIKYNGPGNSINVDTLNEWEQPEAHKCANVKLGHLHDPLEYVQPYFRDDVVFRTLIMGLGSLCLQHFLKKNAAATSGGKFPDLIDVYKSDVSSSCQDHERFLVIIQTAIHALKERGPEEVILSSAPKRSSKDKAQKQQRKAKEKTGKAQRKGGSHSKTGKAQRKDKAQPSQVVIVGSASLTSQIPATSIAGQTRKRKTVIAFDEDNDGSQKRTKGSHSDSQSHRLTRSMSKSGRS